MPSQWSVIGRRRAEREILLFVTVAGDIRPKERGKAERRQNAQHDQAKDGQLVLPQPMPGVLPKRRAAPGFSGFNNCDWGGVSHYSKRNFGFSQTSATSATRFNDHDKARIKQDRTHDHEVVAIEGGGDKIPAQTGNAEDRFHHK